MSTSFRSELFALCKEIQNNDCALMIRKLINDLTITTESASMGKRRNLHGDFAQIAKQNNTEFYGYLFLDDNMDSISIPKFFTVEHLLDDERILIENGQATINRFLKLCLSEISEKSVAVSESINPYSYYKPVNISSKSTSFLSDEDFQPIVSAFKNGTIYKSLMATNYTSLFEKIDTNNMKLLIGSIEREVNQSLGEDVANDLKEFSLKTNSKFSNINEVMFAFALLIFALKSSLALACRTIYRAICGVDLFVLNNDNIISIDKIVSTVICKFYRIFSQDITIDLSGSEMGSIILLDCDWQPNQHIHEFGMLIAQTITFAGEFGESAKYSFVTVNDEMVYIHHLTNEIIKREFPTIKPTQ